METNIALKIRGELTILESDQVILKESNSISYSALEVITRILAFIPQKANIDRIKINGNFPQVEVPIIDTQYNFSENSITFIAKVAVEQAVGNIAQFNLGSTLLELDIAEKIVNSLPKNDVTELELRWKIILSNC